MNNQCVAVLRDEMAPGWAAWFCGREVGKRRSIGQGRMPVLSARMRHVTTTKCSPTYSATEGSRQRMDVKEVHAGAKVRTTHVGGRTPLTGLRPCVGVMSNVPSTDAVESNLLRLVSTPLT